MLGSEPTRMRLMAPRATTKSRVAQRGDVAVMLSMMEDLRAGLAVLLGSSKPVARARA